MVGGEEGNKEMVAKESVARNSIGYDGSVKGSVEGSDEETLDAIIWARSKIFLQRTKALLMLDALSKLVGSLSLMAPY